MEARERTTPNMSVHTSSKEEAAAVSFASTKAAHRRASTRVASLSREEVKERYQHRVTELLKLVATTNKSQRATLNRPPKSKRNYKRPDTAKAITSLKTHVYNQPVSPRRVRSAAPTRLSRMSNQNSNTYPDKRAGKTKNKQVSLGKLLSRMGEVALDRSYSPVEQSKLLKAAYNCGYDSIWFNGVMEAIANHPDDRESLTQDQLLNLIPLSNSSLTSAASDEVDSEESEESEALRSVLKKSISPEEEFAAQTPTKTLSPRRLHRRATISSGEEHRFLQEWCSESHLAAPSVLKAPQASSTDAPPCTGTDTVLQTDLTEVATRGINTEIPNTLSTATQTDVSIKKHGTKCTIC